MANRVLLIDYESQSPERVRGVLHEPNYEVVAAHDGEEALNLFSSSRFDVVLLSGMLPRLPSAEVIREIRRRGGPSAPPILLMVSGYKGSNTKADAQRVGAFDLLPRPFSDETLRQAAAAAIAANEATTRAPAGAAGTSLTSSDIFSDILKEVARDAAPSQAPAKASAAADEEVERRLRDTLSGLAPGGAAAAPRSARTSTSEDVDRLISRTLSGLRTEPRLRPPAPPPAPVTAPDASAPAAPPPPAAPELPPVSAPAPASAQVPPPAPAIAPDRFGQYEILERIASGGMAELFRARRSGVEGFQKIVAIKKILPHIAGDEEFMTMFADEAKLAAQLSHPNIVHIFDLGKIEGGGYFIAMEHVEGRDLRSILHLSRETGRNVPVPLAVSIVSKVAAALDYAHRRRADDGTDLHIVHRDVSPQNILVSTDGDIKLCDFGIAKATSKVSRTESGALKGKIPYMSPEQAWGREVDRRSDIYSLGSVLFEMLAGRKLFSGDSDLEVLEKVRAGLVVAPSSLNREVTPALDTVVLKALAPDPAGRYSSASDLLRDLEAVLRTYEPPPSSGDLAVFVRHLESEDADRRQARARQVESGIPPGAAAPPAQAVAAAPAPKRDEALREGRVQVPEIEPRAPVPPAQTPPPEAAPPPDLRPPESPEAARVFASPLLEGALEESGGRTRLYGLIAAAAVILAGVIFLVVRKSSPAPGPPAPATAVPATAAPSQNAAAPIPTAAPPPIPDQKAIQEEVQRQLAARRREVQKSAESRTDAQRSAAAALAPSPSAAQAPSAAPVIPTAAPPAAPPPEQKAAEAPPKVEPTTAPPPPEPAPAAPLPQTQPAEARTEPGVSPGDLVGPGPGVVEPQLVSMPRISYSENVRSQLVTGKVVVLVLVDENGAVSATKLQSGVASRLVNESVIGSVKGAKFKPATKDGIPVRMWRTVVVDVRP
jgi:TonB family protein